MYNKAIVNAICANHMYEYFIVNHSFEVVQFSEDIVKYCDKDIFNAPNLILFDLVPELVGMEEDLADILQNQKEDLFIPLVFKDPDYYINIRVHRGVDFQTLIILFENITEVIKIQHDSQQINHENLLLLTQIERKNKQLEAYNQEMQKLVKHEVAKNREKQQMVELQMRHAQMGEMIAMITHQWKQPLSAIHALGTLLKVKFALGKLTQKIFSEKMDNLLLQVTHMNQTVNDFQQFFTPSKVRSNFELNATISSVLSLIETEFSIHNIHIRFKKMPKIYLKGYENEYKQVILSILQNAKDALKVSKQKEKMITIETMQKNSYALVTIEDNAGGIPKEMLGHIFDQYVTSKEKGSGLGLYIAKSVIENNMQGKLWVENNKLGAKFYIEV